MNKDIKKLVKGKRVCLLGNAESILNTEKDIDDFDVVCRCNQGFPKGKEDFIGTKTDILFTSINIATKDFYEADPMFVVWCTTKHELISEEFKAEIDEYFTMRDWIALERELRARPSTGAMALYYLMKHTKYSHLTLYGFDFWKSKTWWQDRNESNPHPHSESAEEKYIKWLVDENEDMEIVYG